MQQTHTRLWWMEMLRGIGALCLGLLFILIHVSFFIYALGIYLIVDGCLDIYQVAKGKRATKRKVLSHFGSALSILLGLICIVSHALTSLLILFIIIVRIMSSGVRVIIEARQSMSPYAGLIWLYGGLSALFILALIIFPSHTLGFTLLFLLYFISAYAILDGFYLMGRGLLLRFAPTIFSGSSSQILENQPEFPDNLPPTTRRAIVFVRRLGAKGLGHIAWAFEWNNGWFNTGSVENQKNKPFVIAEEMGFWTTHSVQPAATMQNQETPYDEYKLFYVAQPRPKEAWRTVIWESRQPYAAVRNNCNDVAYDILRVYGVNELLDPAQEHVPNDWYDALPGRSYKIAEHPVIPERLRKMSQRALSTSEILLTIPSHMIGIAPPWRQHGWRAMQELTLTWDKMLKDVRKLFISMSHRLRIKRGVPS